MSLDDGEIPSTSGCATSIEVPGMSKRKAESDSCDYDVHSKRKCCSDAHFIRENSPSVSGNESVWSMQDWETAYCQDTPDTSSQSLDSDYMHNFRFKLGGHLATTEFEADSFSEAENPFGKSDSSDSSLEDGCTRADDVEDNKIEEEAIWGDDDSHSDSHTTDPEISPCDFWVCLRCKCVNKPIPRYCRKCFTVRKNWFPPRPRPKRKKSKFRQRAKTSCVESYNSGLGSFSKESCENDRSEKPSTSAICDTPKDNENDGNHKSVVDRLNNEKCIICMQEEKNSAFVHGNVAHVCCCFRCAKKSWSNSGKCPVCNRKANRIVKIYVA